MELNNLSRFGNYLHDEEIYLRLEEYWVDIFFMWLNKNNIDSDDWRSPYYNTCFVNGKKMMDGNPIFSAISSKTEKVIRIILESNSSENMFTWWTDTTMDSTMPHNELVIICTLNEHDLKKVEEIVTMWIMNKPLGEPD